MANNLFIAATDAYCGKSAVCIGLFDGLRHIASRVGFIKPIGQRYQSRPDIDEDVLLIRNNFHLDTDPADMNPVSIQRARELVLAGKQDELMDLIRRAHHGVARDADVVVIEGTDYARAMSHFDFDLSAVIADSLGAKVLLVASGSGDGRPVSIADLVSTLRITRDSFGQRDCEVIGAIVNKVGPEDFDAASQQIRDALQEQAITVFGVVPYLPLLAMPKLSEIAEALDAKVLCGQQFLSNTVGRTITAAMKPHNMLRYLTCDGMLLITPGDRDDAILAALCSQMSSTYPRIAGLLLTGGLEPEERIATLIIGLSDFRVPVLSVQQDTFTASRLISEMKVGIRMGHTDRITTVIHAIRQHVQQNRIYDALQLKRVRRATPRDFLDRLIDEGRSFHKHIVFPEGNEPRTLQAVARILEIGLAEATLLGDPQEIRDQAADVGANISRARIVNPAASSKTEQYARVFYELRKHRKDVILDAARDLILGNNVYFGTMMVHEGQADGLISGAVHSTQNTIRPAFQIIKTRPDIALASSVFFMALRDKVLVYGDCAIVVDPTAEELAGIALASARTARAFGIEPYVAMLSYSTGTSGKGQMVDKVRQATEMVRAQGPDFPVDGPIQYDAAVDPAVAQIKHPESPVAGKATVFIFPDLDAGNIAYKAVQRSAGAVAVGPILQGLNKPVNDLSRGCVPEDILYVTAVTAIQAQKL